MPDIETVANKADVIVNGYAFTREEDGIHVLNLNSPDKAVVFSEEGEVLETSAGLNVEAREVYGLRNTNLHQRQASGSQWGRR